MSHQLHPVTMFPYVPHVVHESILVVQMMFIYGQFGDVPNGHVISRKMKMLDTSHRLETRLLGFNTRQQVWYWSVACFLHRKRNNIMIVSKKVEPASLRYFASAPLTGKVFATCFCSSTTMLNICIEFLAPIMVLFIGYQVTATHKNPGESRKPALQAVTGHNV